MADVWVGLTHCTDCLALEHLLKTIQADELLWTPVEHTVLSGASTNGACQGSLTYWQGYSNSNTSSELKCKKKKVAVLRIENFAILSMCFFRQWGRTKLSYMHLLFLSHLKRTSNFYLLKHNTHYFIQSQTTTL